MTFIANLFWKFVWWWKQRTGFMVFGPAMAVGTVLSLRSSSDGDALVNIRLDDDYLWMTPVFGRLSSYGKLHCEIPPWIQGEVREVYAKLKPGDRVAVHGEWGFDGVHLLDKAPWYLFPLEVLAAVFRHQPNVRDGWFEIHPVTKLEVL